MIIEFQIEIPKTCLQMNLLMTYFLPLVTSLVQDSSGGSVDKAMAANVSMIRLIQRSWTADIGDCPIRMAPIKIAMMAEILQVT